MLNELVTDMMNRNVVEGGVYRYRMRSCTIQITIDFINETDYKLCGKIYMNDPDMNYENNYIHTVVFDTLTRYDVVDLENELIIVIGNLLKKYCTGDDGEEF